jgi:hypothetical protein
MARAEFGPASKHFRKLSKDLFNAQSRAAIRLLIMAKLPLNLQFYNLKHAKKIQRFLDGKFGIGHYRIVIFDGQKFFNVIYKGEVPSKHNLFILLSAGHFQPIFRPNELFKVC